MVKLSKAQRRQLARSAVGIGAFGLVIAGVWGLWGWPWAAIATGFPPGAFYVWGELRAARGAQPGEVD